MPKPMPFLFSPRKDIEMILSNETYYSVVQSQDRIQFETTVTIKDAKHTAQIIKRQQADSYWVIVFRGDEAGNKTKTKVRAEYSTYQEAYAFLSKLANCASRGDSIKAFTIVKTSHGITYQNDFPSVFEGTRHYCHTLAEGARWMGQVGSRKVNQNPTTPKSLHLALLNTVWNAQGGREIQDQYEVVEA